MGKASNEEAEESEVEGHTPRTSIKGVHPHKVGPFCSCRPPALGATSLARSKLSHWPPCSKVPTHLHPNQRLHYRLH